MRTTKKIILSLLLLMPFLIKGQLNYNLENLEKINYTNSDLVILGQVIEIDTISLISKIKVFEIFKGKAPEVISFSITNGNTFIPEPAGLWLIYAIKVNDTLYSISDKSISKSNLNPDRIFYYTPEPPKKRNKKTDYQIQSIKIKIKALTEWNNELYKLRKKMIY